jgi:hypothetical protein
VNEILMRAVVEAAAFLELSPDDVLDPDIAVTQAEADRVSSDDYRDFLRQFPEAMGL